MFKAGRKKSGEGIQAASLKDSFGTLKVFSDFPNEMSVRQLKHFSWIVTPATYSIYKVVDEDLVDLVYYLVGGVGAKVLFM